MGFSLGDINEPAPSLLARDQRASMISRVQYTGVYTLLFSYSVKQRCYHLIQQASRQFSIDY